MLNIWVYLRVIFTCYSLLKSLGAYLRTSGSHFGVPAVAERTDLNDIRRVLVLKLLKKVQIFTFDLFDRDFVRNAFRN